MPDANDDIQIADVHNNLIGRLMITIMEDDDAKANAKAYMPVAGDIVAVTFFNDSGANFTAAAKVTNDTVGDIMSSTATLNNHITERLTAGIANNTGIAKAHTITLTTGATVGTGPTVAILEVEYKLNAVA